MGSRILGNATTRKSHAREIAEQAVGGRKRNIGRVLSALADRWQLGGVDYEGDMTSGSSRFWAKEHGAAERNIFEIPNEALNGAALSEAEIAAYLNAHYATATSTT